MLLKTFTVYIILYCARHLCRLPLLVLSRAKEALAACVVAHRPVWVLPVHDRLDSGARSYFETYVD
jgi:hypothetical protein